MISKRFVSESTNNFFGMSFMILLVSSLAFAIVRKIFANALELNYFEYLIEIFTSQRMILYLIFAFYLFAITKLITEITVQELIRFGDFFKYVVNFFTAVIVIVSSYIFSLLALYSIVGIGLPIDNVFENSFYFSPVLAGITSSPAVVLFISVFHIALFLVTITMVLKTIFTLFNYKAYTISVISIFSLMLVSISTGRTSLHWIFEFDAYISFSNAFNCLNDKFYLFYLTEMVTVITCVLLLKYKWNRKKQ